MLSRTVQTYVLTYFASAVNYDRKKVYSLGLRKGVSTLAENEVIENWSEK
jgi:hypothetical protein